MIRSNLSNIGYMAFLLFLLVGCVSQPPGNEVCNFDEEQIFKSPIAELTGRIDQYELAQEDFGNARLIRYVDTCGIVVKRIFDKELMRDVFNYYASPNQNDADANNQKLVGDQIDRLTVITQSYTQAFGADPDKYNEEMLDIYDYSLASSLLGLLIMENINLNEISITGDEVLDEMMGAVKGMASPLKKITAQLPVIQISALEKMLETNLFVPSNRMKAERRVVRMAQVYRNYQQTKQIVWPNSCASPSFSDPVGVSKHLDVLASVYARFYLARLETAQCKFTNEKQVIEISRTIRVLRAAIGEIHSETATLQLESAIATSFEKVVDKQCTQERISSFQGIYQQATKLRNQVLCIE